MVRTFEEWFSSLEKSKQRYLKNNCEIIQCFDKDGKMTRFREEVVEYKLMITCNKDVLNKEEFAEQYRKAEKVLHSDLAIQILYASRLKTLNALSEFEYHNAIENAANKMNEREVQPYLTESQYKDYMKQVASHGFRCRLAACIYASDDPDNPDWSMLVSEKAENNYFDYEWFNLIPLEEGLKLIRKDLSIIRYLIAHINHLDDKSERDRQLKRIREFIFCEDGISINDRNKLIVSLYSDRNISSFIQEILPIDIRYGKLFKDIYSYKRYFDKSTVSEMNQIMNAKKRDLPTEEERAQDGWFDSDDANTYRYSKTIRQMAAIFKACIEKKYPKYSTSLIGDTLCLLRMYEYDWNKVFDAVYGC